MRALPTSAHARRREELGAGLEARDWAELKITLILAGLVMLLVGGVAVVILVNPYAALGLAPVLLAIAKIVQAVRGTNSSERGRPSSSSGNKPRRKLQP